MAIADEPLDGILYVSEDRVVQIQAVTNFITKLPVNDIVGITIEVRAENDVTVLQSGTFSYEAGSDGFYSVTLDGAIALVHGTRYYVHILQPEFKIRRRAVVEARWHRFAP